MLFMLPELDSDMDLDNLNNLLAAEEQLGDSQEDKVNAQVTQIILRRSGESLTDYNKRVDRFINYIKFLDNTAYLDEQIKRLQSLKSARKNLAKRLTNLVLYRLEVSNVKKVETSTYKISVVGKGGKQPVEIDYDEKEDLDLIPQEFVKSKTTRSVDKDAIAEALKSGVKLGWARLLERGNRLSIK